MEPSVTPDRWSERLRRAALDGPRPPPEARSAGSSVDLQWAWVWALAAVATLATFAGGALAYILIEDRWPDGPLAHWNRWDSLHYLRLAQEGYGDGSPMLAMWPPLYSWLVRGVALLCGDALLAGVLVSSACYVGALALLYRLTALDLPEPVARRTLLYWSLFPTAYFLHIAYSEALFALLVLGSFYAARRGHWAVVGALGGLAALTRVTWMPLLPALLVEYLAQREFRWRAIRADVLWLALLPAGSGVFLWINYTAYGDAFAFLDVARSVMSKEVSPPWVGARAMFDHAFATGPSRAITIGLFELVAGLGALVAALWTALRLRASYAVYMLAAFVILTFNSWWLGTLRYWLPLFPGFWMLALWGGRRRSVHMALCIGFGVTQALLVALFVRGHWTY